MKKLVLSIISIFLISCSFQLKKSNPEPEIPAILKPKTELRGAWITHFDYVDINADSMKSKIVNIMKTLGNANFNAVFFQLRSQSETFYPSPYDPWSRVLSCKNPGFDPAKLAIDEARKNGLKFYAYINLLPIRSDSQVPKDSSHLLCKQNPKIKDDWILRSDYDSLNANTNHRYLNPAHPEVHVYLKKVVRHLVESYDIDGLHFGRIHYSGETILTDSISQRQFQKDSLISQINRLNWARKQVTDLVEDVVTEVMLIKPYLEISAATWGFNPAYDPPDYEQFGSGCSQYYQDGIKWLDKGLMDFIVPMISWNPKNSLQDLDKRWIDYKRRTSNQQFIFPGIRIHNYNSFEPCDIKKQIEFIRKNNSRGTVLFSTGSLNQKTYRILKDSIFTEAVAIPENLKRMKAENFIQLNVKKLLSEKNQAVEIFSRTFRADADGEISFLINKLPGTITIKVEETEYKISTDEWNIPYHYQIEKDGSLSRQIPWVEMRRIPGDVTNHNTFPILCKTDYPARVSINDKNLKLYKTGIFFDNLKLNEGVNRITAKVEFSDSVKAIYSKAIDYKKQPESQRSVFPLWIDENSFLPAADVVMLPDDHVKISFKASKGQTAAIKIKGIRKPLLCVRYDFSDYSLYETMLPLRLLKPNKPVTITAILKTDGKKILKYTPAIELKTLHEDEFPWVKTIKDETILTYETGKIRLGGPIRAEYPEGIILRTNGKSGDNYRIHLDNITQAYINEKDITISDPIIPPSYYITNLYCTSTDSGDVVRIPYLRPIPYTVIPEPHLNRIRINLYGAKTSSTWITHHNNRRFIKRITWDQTTPETYTIFINLITDKIWGYDISQTGKSLIFHIKHPPAVKATLKKPLAGLTVAIEAGHGGRNYGAVGPSGLKEKDVNLSLSLMLEKLLRSKGAEVVQVRSSDKYIYLEEKRDIARNEDTDLLVSIHANAGGTRGGYLGVKGTSTYWHNPFWAPLAEKVYEQLLDLDLAEFGVIGSFNYKVTRISEMPAILVEQAFMSNAEDEEKLADPKFRQQMAEKIYKGILDYLEYMIE